MEVPSPIHFQWSILSLNSIRGTKWGRGANDDTAANTEDVFTLRCEQTFQQFSSGPLYMMCSLSYKRVGFPWISHSQLKFPPPPYHLTLLQVYTSYYMYFATPLALGPPPGYLKNWWFSVKNNVTVWIHVFLTSDLSSQIANRRQTQTDPVTVIMDPRTCATLQGSLQNTWTK